MPLVIVTGYPCSGAHPSDTVGVWVRSSCGRRVLGFKVPPGDRQDAAGGGAGQVHAGEGERCPGVAPDRWRETEPLYTNRTPPWRLPRGKS